MAMQPARLSANDLSCQRGYRLLFSGLSFDLPAGGALHITGANGTGKSSLMRILAGLLRPAAGTIARDGTLGLMNEHPALDPHLPLKDALAFWSRIDGGVIAAGGLGLRDLMDVPVRFLSTGQRKRAALARLNAQNAAIWLLDEPLNGLDGAAVRTAEAMVAAHCAQGGIAVVASHQAIALPGADTLAIADFAP